MWWLVLALALFAVVVAWLVVLPIVSRRYVARRHNKDSAQGPVPVAPSKTMRDMYRDRIGALGQEFDKGTIDERELHQQLSAIVREFVEQVRGVRATHMTLTDLKDDPAAAPIADIIARCYMPAFSREGVAPHQPGQPQPHVVNIQDALLVVTNL